ncbi:hypothetical protein [Streptomyces sp. FR-008]|uniref:hypothetical protein n=1 Tax=Streptomyces sp. FR-008 TaxID=206662 RepID=UPI0007208A77|nr:hypothetical protein [Streptomyces sp. FR-008]ALM42575.1 putative membrane protein [Streptomyces sp. FR-008]
MSGGTAAREKPAAEHRPAWAKDPAPEAPPPTAPVTPARRRPRLRAVVPAVLLAAGLALYWLPIPGLDEAALDAMGGLGLVGVLPWPVLAGAALLVVAFAALLWPSRPQRLLLGLVLVATVVSLHALPAVVEEQPRFATAWQHLGFLEYLDRTGGSAQALDARWSWPGFFAAAAFVLRACGVTDPAQLAEVVRWWPLAVNLLALVPLALLARSVRAGWRARWCGVWFFALSSWVGQDYFSPQSFTYLLYLAFAALLLRWFLAPSAPSGGMLPGAEAPPDAPPGRRAVLLGVALALFAAAVPAHQLTPFVMLGVVTVLVVLGRCALRGLPLLLGVVAVGWVCFLAEPYWSGHFDELFGGIGGLGANVTSSVTGRIEGGSATHQLVLYSRVALAGLVMALACWGWWRRRDAGYRERALPVLAFVPAAGFALQAYGGEMALRVFLFALPGAALLAALAFFPRAGTSERERAWDRVSLAPLAALLAGLVLVGGFLVARWGNEAFERVRPGEVAAMEWVYAHADPTVRLLWLSEDPEESVTPALPWGSRAMERVRYVPTQASPRPGPGRPAGRGPAPGGPGLVPDRGPRPVRLPGAGRRLLDELGAAAPRHPGRPRRPGPGGAQRRRRRVRAARGAAGLAGGGHARTAGADGHLDTVVGPGRAVGRPARPPAGHPGVPPPPRGSRRPALPGGPHPVLVRGTAAAGDGERTGAPLLDTGLRRPGGVRSCGRPAWARCRRR